RPCTRSLRSPGARGPSRPTARRITRTLDSDAMAEDPNVRASDEQRDRAARAIREHFAAGRLTDAELSERVQAAYSARTEGELERLLADLPKLPASPAERKAELAERRRHLER